MAGLLEQNMPQQQAPQQGQMPQGQQGGGHARTSMVASAASPSVASGMAGW
jgi:hypothetical protein